MLIALNLASFLIFAMSAAGQETAGGALAMLGTALLFGANVVALDGRRPRGARS